MTPSAIVIVVAGAAAAWFAAGSTGMLGHPLQHALTWLALAVAIVAAWPKKHSFATWAILAVGAILALFSGASRLPTVNVLAVAIMLAAIAQAAGGLSGRVALIMALAAMLLALFRFACDCIPTVWLAADAKGWLLGRIAGWLTGSRLEVGATFGGLDLLVLMTAIYVGWLVCTAPPRRGRAIWAALAILIGHCVYLAVLAHAEDLLAALPARVVPPESDIDHVGIWTWSNGLRTLVPWNLPLLALAINGAILACMFRFAPWIPVVEIDPEKLKKLKEKEEKIEIPGSVLATDLLFGFGPPLLAVAVTVTAALGLNRSDLQGKTVLAYEKGYLNWIKPEYDSPLDGTYGMLPAFVESLGGKFAKSATLSKEELDSAAVLLLLHPDKPWPKDTLERVWDYVRGGGSLLLVADPQFNEGDSRSTFNDVLQPTAMQVRFDTAVMRAGDWEQSYEVLAHPASAGIDDLRNRFGIQLGSSIRTCWPARPILVGRWGWSDPGNDAANTGVFNVQRRRATRRSGAGRRAIAGPRADRSVGRQFPLAQRGIGRFLPICRAVVRLSGRPAGESARPLAAVVGPGDFAGPGCAVGVAAGGVADHAHFDGAGRFVGLLHRGGALVGPGAAGRPPAQIAGLQ